MKKKNAFVNAANGIGQCIRQQLNFRIQLITTVTVIGAGVFYSISNTEWLFVIGCCSLVLSIELLNSALENVCDLVTKDFHPLIKIAKDTAAGAVLISAAGSAIAGIIIFLPKIIHYFK